MKIQALINKEETGIPEFPETLKVPDIFVTKLEYTEEYDEDGNKITKKHKKKINLTKKINETAKLLKIDTLQDKYNKLKEIIEKGE